MEDIPVIKHESKRIVTSCREGSRLGCVGQVSWRMMRVRIVQYTCCDEESIHEEEPAKHISTGCTLEVANKRTSALYAFPCPSARFSDSVAATINESRIRILNQRRWRTSLHRGTLRARASWLEATANAPRRASTRARRRRAEIDGREAGSHLGMGRDRSRFRRPSRPLLLL